MRSRMTSKRANAKPTRNPNGHARGDTAADDDGGREDPEDSVGGGDKSITRATVF